VTGDEDGVQAAQLIFEKWRSCVEGRSQIRQNVRINRDGVYLRVLSVRGTHGKGFRQKVHVENAVLAGLPEPEFGGGRRDTTIPHQDGETSHHYQRDGLH
jgi:hypothetical protein